MKPKVSIIVPIYNTEKYIYRCLNSLINQSLQEIEIILVDDESPDSCPRICDDYLKRDNRIKVIHKKNEGLGYARNSGIEIAQGEYIGFVDSDDFIELNMFEKLYLSAKKNNVQVAYCNVKYFKEDKVIRLSNFVDSEVIWEGQNDIKSLLLDLISAPLNFPRDTVLGASVWKGIFKKSIFIKHNIKFVSERIFNSEDTIFNIDYIPYTNKISMIPNHLYYYCQNSISLTTTYKPNRFIADKILYQEKCNRFQKKFEFNNQIIERFNKNFISTARIAIIHEVSNIRLIGLRKLYSNIKTICNDQELKNILRKFPISKLPLKHKIFTLCMKNNCIILLILIVLFHIKLSKI